MNYKKLINVIFNPYIILIIITIASLTPSNEFPKNDKFSIPNLDKIIHFIMYFVLTFSLLYKNITKIFKIRKINIYILIFASLYGILMEILQHIMNLGRDANLYDFLANESGIFICFLVYKLLYHNSPEL